jgi:hypothetical protein
VIASVSPLDVIVQIAPSGLLTDGAIVALGDPSNFHEPDAMADVSAKSSMTSAVTTVVEVNPVMDALAVPDVIVLPISPSRNTPTLAVKVIPSPVVAEGVNVAAGLLPTSDVGGGRKLIAARVQSVSDTLDNL